jgi:xanthine dehydrogenase accessory factor
MKELTELLEAWRKAPKVPHAVATVLRVEGSSYRRPGARMLVDVHGRVAGSVSGGCLERKVISEAQQALSDNRMRLMTFDTTDQDDLAFGSSLGCQGKIWIGIEVLKAGQGWRLESLVRKVRERRVPAALLTRIIHQGNDVHFDWDAVFADQSFEATDLASTTWHTEAQEVLRARKSCFVGDELRDAAFIEWLAPPVSLLLFGGGPDVPPMVKLARELGHEITVIDRRPDFAVAEQFPGADRVLAVKPYQISRHICIDDRTVAVVMNHHYDTDRDVLVALLPLGLRYIAMLGPRRRTDRILAELEEDGLLLSEEMRGSLHAPAGLDLGAETPEQIALAILAEIQSTLAGRAGGQLKLRQAPIHIETKSPRALVCDLPA